MVDESLSTLEVDVEARRSFLLSTGERAEACGRQARWSAGEEIDLRTPWMSFKDLFKGS